MAISSCQNGQSKSARSNDPIIQEIKSPAVNESSVPNLHVNEQGKVFLTWIEDTEEKITILKYSNLTEDGWLPASEITRGNNWIINWADFPTITSFASKSIAVNYLVEIKENTFSYDVNLAISNNAGKTWSSPIIPHKDETQTEHGFVSLVPYNDEKFMAIWLDGRNYVTEDKTMTLRSAIINKEGEILSEFLIDEDVCSCCQTSAISDGDEILLVYRDRTEQEIRDISLVKFQEGSWSEPKTVANDNWKIGGCPVNGPAIDASGNNIVVAWFTMANETPTVKLAFSNNMGNSFKTPIIINNKKPLGRTDVVSMPDGSAFVSWMEENAKETYIKVRRIYQDGKKEEPIVVAKTSIKRASGFPKMVREGKYLIFAWTDVNEKLSIKTAKIKI